MCLRLKSEKTRIQTAKNDIVVYKALRAQTKHTIERLSEVKHGDSFTGIIKGIECEGKISIDEDGEIYFCTNNENLNRCSTIDRLGYKYNWIMSGVVRKIVVNDKIIRNTEIIGYQTIYQGFKVKMGETYTSELEKIDDSIEKGLHSFETMEDAKYLSHVVAKCIIPKGSKYYKGTFLGDISYASDRLTYLKIIY